MARKGILSTDITRPVRLSGTPPAPQRGAVGALQSSLTKLQENAVQDIDPTLIDDAGVEDRLGANDAAHEQLKDSLQTYGQQVPVLLRPNTDQPGRFEIVYGRRRLRALKELGQPVKAMIRQLDDHALVLAQGQENTARQDLSFIEKASFAAQLEQMDYDRKTIAAALSIDQPMVSRLLKVGTAFPMDTLRAIGSAPAIGRDRWNDLIRALDVDGAQSRLTARLAEADFPTLDSDMRFEAVLSAVKTPVKSKKPLAKARTLRSSDGDVLGDIKATPRGVTVNIPSRTTAAFGAWINDNAEALLNDLHDQWKKRSEDN